MASGRNPLPENIKSQLLEYANGKRSQLIDKLRTSLATIGCSGNFESPLINHWLAAANSEQELRNLIPEIHEDCPLPLYVLAEDNGSEIALRLADATQNTGGSSRPSSTRRNRPQNNRSNVSTVRNRNNLRPVTHDALSSSFLNAEDPQNTEGNLPLEPNESIQHSVQRIRMQIPRQAIDSNGPGYTSTDSGLQLVLVPDANPEHNGDGQIRITLRIPLPAIDLNDPGIVRDGGLELSLVPAPNQDDDVHAYDPMDEQGHVFGQYDNEDHSNQEDDDYIHVEEVLDDTDDEDADDVLSNLANPQKVYYLPAPPAPNQDDDVHAYDPMDEQGHMFGQEDNEEHSNQEDDYIHVEEVLDDTDDEDADDVLSNLANPQKVYYLPAPPAGPEDRQHPFQEDPQVGATSTEGGSHSTQVDPQEVLDILPLAIVHPEDNSDYGFWGIHGIRYANVFNAEYVLRNCFVGFGVDQYLCMLLNHELFQFDNYIDELRVGIICRPAGDYADADGQIWGRRGPVSRDVLNNCTLEYWRVHLRNGPWTKTIYKMRNAPQHGPVEAAIIHYQILGVRAHKDILEKISDDLAMTREKVNQIETDLKTWVADIKEKLRGL